MWRRWDRNGAPTNKVHDLYSIAFVQGRRGPLRASNDPVIQFDRYSFGLQPETFYDSVNRRALGYIGLFTIHNDGQL
jgi:hypothetical protein